MLDTSMERLHFLKPVVVFQMLVFITKVRGNLVGALGGEITELQWREWGDVRTEALSGGNVEEKTSVVAQDV